MKTLILVASLVSVYPAYGAQQELPIEYCNQHTPYGKPSGGTAGSKLICRSGYLLRYDFNAKIPAWVSYQLTPETAVGCVSRSNAYTSDKSLPAGNRAEPSDYAGSIYDIGHQANNADMRWSVQAEQDSFIMSNMAPQLAGFNRGVWKRLEDQTRAWVTERQHTMLIYVGPIYDKPAKETLGPGKITIPKGYYKILTDTVTREAIAFRFTHTPSVYPLDSFVSTVKTIQDETGIKFPLPKQTVKLTQGWPSVKKSAKAAKDANCDI